MQGRGGVAREIAHGVHLCGFSSCDTFRPDGGVEARVLSAGSAHVAAGLLNPPTLRGVWGGVGEIRLVDRALREYRGAGAGGWVGVLSSHSAAAEIGAFTKGK